ncbi:MAG: hypothetical protein AB1480_02885 [Nitrospirota bacterium]
MPVEPTNRIYETPLIRRGENTGLPSKKKQKKQKKESEKGERKIDIKV